MSAKFTAIQKLEDEKNWYIELADTMQNKIKKCDDLELFSQNIEQMGAEYGNDIEVQWGCDDDVPEEFIHELRVAMMTYQEKYQDEIDKEFENKGDTQ
ncbi:MAG: hypothetical protein DRG11_03045 [Epsilonproteobacteria bacterium]|nr:MAG: hypothetical protein DRG11_03045 [Campylobacterota bacterium]